LLVLSTALLSPSLLYRRTTTASTATMMTIAPTINQFRAVFRCLVARISCCAVSRVARCAAHRVSLSCGVSCGSAMVFSFVIRAVVVCGSCSLSHSLWLMKSWDRLASHDALAVTGLADNSPAASPCSTLHRAASSQASSAQETFASVQSASPALRVLSPLSAGGDADTPAW